MEDKLILELEEILELPNGTLQLNTHLNSLESWDSMAKLSLIVLLSDTYDKKTSNDDLKQFKTIQDIFNFIKK
jgi:acyl carrier protein